MANLSYQERLNIFNYQNPGPKLAHGIYYDFHKKISAIQASYVGVMGRSPRTLRRTHPLTRRASSEQRRWLILLFFSIFIYYVIERYTEVARYPDSLAVVE